MYKLPALVKIVVVLEIFWKLKKTASFCMHTNVVFQISQELKRIFKVAARFLSLTKVLFEIIFSKSPFHTETSQSIPSSNHSLFSDSGSIIDPQKIHYIDFRPNQASALFSELGARLNLFFLRKKLVSLY